MERAALYIRVSTDEQARHGLSLGEQRADLERYAREHGYTVADIYADEGNTARKAISKRKELQRLLNDVRADKIDIILFKCLDRWFRSVKDYYKVQEVLDAHHVDWECTQEKYNTTSTNGRLMLNIKLSVAQNESDQTSDRIRYVNEGKIRRHEVLTGRHSFGYTIKDKHYAIVPEEAEIVRFIYARAIAGDSCNRITHLIYDKWGRAMSIRHARCILLNDVYVGTYHGIEDYHEPIIDKTTNERVKALLRAHRRPTRSNYVYLFTGKMVCPSCGGILVGHRALTKKHKYVAVYCCSKHNVSGVMVGPDACKFGGGVRETVVERWLVTHFDELLHDYILSFRVGKTMSGPPPEQKKKTIEGKLSRLKELYIDGLVDKDEFTRRAANYKHDIDELDLETVREQHPSPLAASTYKSINGFESAYEALDRQHKREFWQTLIKRIEIGERPPRCGIAYNDFRVTFA